MTPVSAALFAVAKELAQTAKDSLPELRDGEHVLREWYTDGVYYRETQFDGEKLTCQYDFRQRKKAPIPKKQRQKKATA